MQTGRVSQPPLCIDLAMFSSCMSRWLKSYHTSVTHSPMLSSCMSRWLKAELAAAEAAGEKVITAGHHPVGEGSARSTHMAWNRR